MHTIELPCYGIVVDLVKDGDNPGKYLAGKITVPASQIPKGIRARAMYDGLTSMILACASAGINIQDPAFIEAIESTMNAVENHTD